MVAIILAAGYATRLYPLTQNTPKALLKIGGKTLLDHVLDKVYAVDDVKQTIIVSNDKFYGQFAEWKASRAESRISGGGPKPRPVILNDGTSSELTRLGAIGDIQFALDEMRVDDELLIIASDNFFTYGLTDLIDFYRLTDADCITVKRHGDRNALKSLGVAIIDADMRVVDFVEKPQNPQSDIAVYATYV